VKTNDLSKILDRLLSEIMMQHIPIKLQWLG